MEFSYPLISAKVIADTRSPSNVRITTFEIVYPRCILAEVNTHGVTARSSASSRAIPVAKRIDDVTAQPFIPAHSVPLKNKKGMQAVESISDADYAFLTQQWLSARDAAVAAASSISGLIHKQHANRLLEPFMYQKTVITATEWDNFFELRISPYAQPEFIELARKMKDAMEASLPSSGLIEFVDGAEECWHLPYIDPIDDEELLTTESLETVKNVSAARCARVSYHSNTSKLRSTAAEDIKLAAELRQARHMSPFDHQAVADETCYKDGQLHWLNPDLHGRFYGWIPLRVEVEHLTGCVSRRSSFAPLTLGDLR